MEHKIFLGKYRVAADEMALAAPLASSTGVMVAEQHAVATIYRGEEIDSGRDVAIEVIPAAGFKTSVREQLEAEALAAKKISHINIPALYDFGVEDDQIIYVTEYFEGTSAEEWVNAHGPMPTGAVLRIALQVISAMGASAFHKISHHAINPANVMLVPGQTPEGDWPLVKVLHFVGVAPTFSSSDMSVASFDKSTHYASPEQLREGKVDFRSEIYSLGATLWFLVTGAPPLIAPNGPLAMQPTTNGLAVDKLNGMPKKVRRLLAQMLAVDPAARPQDPLGFYRQIQDCLAQVDRRESMARRFGVPLASGAPALPFAKPRRFSPKLLALAALFIALATAAAVMLPRYLYHQRVRNAEEPIGVPIGVPDGTAPAPAPAPANVASTNPTEPANAPSIAPSAPATVASSDTANSNPAPTIRPLPADTNQPVTAQNTTTPENPPPAPAQTAPVVAANEPAPAPAKREESAAPPANLRTEQQEPPKIVSNNPPVTREPEPAPAPPANVKPERQEQPKIAANESRTVREPERTKARQPDEPARTEREESSAPATTSRNTDVAEAIPTPRSVRPEVRRAEPATPAEGPDETQPTAERKVATTTSRAKKDRVAKAQPAQDEEVVPRAELADADEQADQAEPAERTMPRLPPGKTRARFIGVTADGNWMFSLPSKKIVIVPPPPGG
jgi:serine/threonine protein kinase